MGVIWKGPQRWLTLAVTGAVCMGPIAAAPAFASAPKPPKDAAKVVGTLWGDAKADKVALNVDDTYDPRRDPGSLYTITEAIGARQVWRARDDRGRALTGRGVTVAVLDSGVAAVPGLDAPGKIVRGPELSLESNSQTPLSPVSFGHGTHMAGIIAAKDAIDVDAKSGAPKGDDASKQLGVAPDAQVLALKLAS